MLQLLFLLFVQAYNVSFVIISLAHSTHEAMNFNPYAYIKRAMIVFGGLEYDLLIPFGGMSCRLPYCFIKMIF